MSTRPSPLTSAIVTPLFQPTESATPARAVPPSNSKFADLHREVIAPRDEDVDAAVAVDVGHRDAALPADRVGDAGPGRDVLELKVSLVAVQPVGAQVRGEVDVEQTVAVAVSHSAP